MPFGMENGRMNSSFELALYAKRHRGVALAVRVGLVLS